MRHPLNKKRRILQSCSVKPTRAASCIPLCYLARHGICGLTWHGLVWCGLVWLGCGMVWYGMVWHKWPQRTETGVRVAGRRQCEPNSSGHSFTCADCLFVPPSSQPSWHHHGTIMPPSWHHHGTGTNRSWR